LALEFVGDVGEAEKRFDVWETRIRLKAASDAKAKAVREAEAKRKQVEVANEGRASESTRVGSVSGVSPAADDVDVEMDDDEDAEGDEVEEVAPPPTPKGKKKEVEEVRVLSISSTSFDVTDFFSFRSSCIARSAGIVRRRRSRVPVRDRWARSAQGASN
jgi:hypothetical protein